LGALRNRRHRDRRRRHVACAQVEYDAAVLDFLVGVHWLAKSDEGDPHAVSDAIGRAMADAALRWLIERGWR
jgi:hypothetical protein